jgi:hypothetical protein
MSDLLNGITSTISSCAAWAHDSIKELPIAGPFYTLVREKTDAPLGTIVNTVKDYISPYFQKAYTAVEPKVREYSIIATVVGSGAVIFVCYRLFTSRKPNP